jgi:murein L,D-transpeptidase YafK
MRTGLRCFASSAAAWVLAAAVPAADSLPTTTASPGSGAMPTLQDLPVADRVVVRKSERKLLLMSGDSILRTYKIALGLNPVGHKERAGDFRTPEGRYQLTRRNTRSEYFLSIQVSYPSERDVQRARRNRWDPGGAIMIHGLPNQLRHAPSYYESRDWTDGCIAVSNADMLEIWLLTPENVPIEIRP